MKTKIIDFYKKEYRDDYEMIEIIRNDVIFEDLFYCLDNYIDVYSCIFIDDNLGDSIVRERLFEKLSSLLDIDYNEIHDQWMMSDETKKYKKLSK